MSDLPYRQPRKPTRYQYEFSKEWGKIWGFLFCLALGSLFLMFPAIFFHGEKEDAFTGQEHWAWNAHSTIAVGTWWGILLAVFICLAFAGRPSKPGSPRPPDFPVDLRYFHEDPFLDPPEGIHPPF